MVKLPTPVPLTTQQKQAFRDAARPATARRNDKARVREVLPAIRQKLQAGWSYEEVRQALEKTLGFQGSLKTLYQYVWQLSREPGAAAPSSTALPAELAQLAAQPTMKAPGSAPAPLPSNASNLAPSTSRQEANHESLVRRLNAPL